jgi:septum formation protein
MSNWRKPGRRIILASNSPRRRTILRDMGFAFETMAPSVHNEERFLKSKAIGASLMELARAKAASVSVKHPEALVLGADTVVTLGDRIMGKPKDTGEAAAMLRLLSNKKHVVYSAVALVCEACRFVRTAVEKTTVVVREIGEEEITGYLRGGGFFDKAGAYAIQGKAMVFVKKIDGCYYTVVGLPVQKTIDLFTAYLTRKETDDVC